MMECKAALDEAGGDYERAKEILREKGKAAAAKRADRATGAGLVAVASAPGKIAAIIVECETDFVAINEDFKKAVNGMAATLLQKAPANISLEDALKLQGDSGETLAQQAEGLVATIRENIQIKHVLKLEGAEYGYYVHHDGKKGAIVELSAANDTVGKDLGMQIVSLNAEFVTKDELPQDRLSKELELEIERAIKEGKPREMAEKIAQGRVNKEFVKSVVLLEQSFFKDGNKTVGQYVSESAGDLKVQKFHKLTIGV